MKFQFRVTLTSGQTNGQVEISGIDHDVYSGARQAVTLESNDTGGQAYTHPSGGGSGPNHFSFFKADSDTNLRMAGDIALVSKPTWAT